MTSYDLRVIESPHAPEAIGPYSQAIVVGDIIYCSGVLGRIKGQIQLVEGGVEAQTHQIFLNLKQILQAAGGTLSSVVKTTVFLKDMEDFSKMNGVYSQYMGEHKPARSTVQVARLPMDALVEIECVAVVVVK